MNSCLPFPRGKTYSQSSGMTLSDTTASNLEGKIYEVKDTVHGTGRTVLLRVVKNDTGRDITVARKCGEFATTSATDFGCRIGTFPGDTEGAVAKPLDDAYTIGATIPDDDLFYVVEAGLCYIQGEASSVDLTAPCAVAIDSSGLINGAKAAAGEYVVGTLQLSSSDEGDGTDDTSLLVDVKAGLDPPPAAG